MQRIDIGSLIAADHFAIMIKNTFTGNDRLLLTAAFVYGVIPMEFNRLCKEKKYVNDILFESSKTASYLATKALRKVKKKIGFYSL